MRAPFTAAVVLGLLLLGGCTSDEPPTADEPRAWTRTALEAEVFSTAPADPPGVAAPVTGTVPNRVTPIPAQLRVTEVMAGPNSTVLRFTLRGTGPAPATVDLQAFNQARPLTDDIRDIVLVDVAAERQLRPFVGVSAGDHDVSMCACADSPPEVGAEERSLSGVFPALAPNATTVTVQVPGFPPVPEVPVTRIP